MDVLSGLDILRVSALLHDIGKLECWAEETRRETIGGKEEDIILEKPRKKNRRKAKQEV